ncbi:hypothetical protein TSAR_002866 [Trichomalopsis sarcophagae]|uniref:Pro-resilin n=1 Tax=Trichomalopsis sarcophagae TaxID=543379 RepID=A0A232FMV0_9HYME|nr:hypothetical protein TSAR_002866 [Trichomalopsis sarcophagae]
MNRLQFALLIGLCSAASGGLLPGDGYQYDRPAFGAADFGQRNNALGRLPTAGAGRGADGFGAGFNSRQPAGFGFPAGYQGNQGYQGYQGNAGYQGFQGNNQGFRGDNGASYRGFDGGDNGRSAPRPYSFQYEVRDAASGNDYGQQESGDAAGVVRGEYRVLLPDSRTQIVRYTADDANGYVADVRYEGQAQFPRPGFFGAGGAAAGGPGFFGGAAGGGAGGYQGRGNVAGYNGATDGFGVGGGASNQYLPPSAGSYGK